MTLVAHYKLDGNANDETGTYNVTSTDVTYATGVDGQAASFNGSSSRAYGVSPLQGATEGAFGALFRPASGGLGISMQVGTNTGNNHRGYLYFNPSTRLFGARLGNNPSITYNTTSVTLDEWVHAFVVFDASAALLYINGGNTQAVPTGPVGNNMALGAYAATSLGGSFNSYYTGLIDDARIYDHALTGAEVLSLYNSYFATGRYIPLIGGGSLLTSDIPLIGDPAGGLIH